MPDAVRTVHEDENVRIIEGLAYPFRGPFKGKDSYGTTFSARTNFYWDLFPDSQEDPKFTRPLTYQHGFDAEVGLRRVGGWSPVRTNQRGVWVQAQLDKHDEYYSEIAEVLDADALAFSGGSAEHSVRIDRKTGEVLDWPAYELALTPTPSNPMAIIAARAAQAQDTIRIILEREEPAVRIIKQEGAKWVIYSEDGTQKLGEFDTEEEAKARLAEIEMMKHMDEESAGRSADYDEGYRAGRKISTATAAQITSAINALQSLLAEQTPETPEAGPPDASRAAEPLTTVRIVGRTDAEPLRADWSEIATRAANEEVTRLLKR